MLTMLFSVILLFAVGMIIFKLIVFLFKAAHVVMGILLAPLLIIGMLGLGIFLIGWIVVPVILVAALCTALVSA